MTELQAVVLGFLQGAGEFLPISSSAHLALAPRLFGWGYQGLAYDVMLHLGTLLAVLIYFRRDWLEIFRSFLAAPSSPAGRMLPLLAAASVPAAVAGLALNDLAETAFRDPRWIAAALIGFSGLIYLADRNPAQELNESAFSLRHALLIGLAQCLALMPGASRSGMTIMAALLLGYKRSASARISFLLSTPVILGASLLEARKITPDQLNPAFALGMASSFLSGLVFIWLLMSWLKSRTLAPFLVYRVLLGAAILLWAR